MKCPVCQTVNADNADLCKECQSDLEIYRQLDKIDNNLSSKKRTAILLSVLIGLLVLGGGAALVQLNNTDTYEGESSAILEEENKALRSQLDELKTEADQLKLQLQNYTESETAAEEPAETTTVSEDEPEAEVRVHEFKEGETLWRVASMECGSGKGYTQIMKDNNISDPTQVRAGTRLKISCEK